MNNSTKVLFACANDIVSVYWKLVNMLPEEFRTKQKVVAINSTAMLTHAMRRKTFIAEFAVSATVNELLKGKVLPEGVSLRVGLPLAVSNENTYFVPSEDLKLLHGRLTVLGKSDAAARIDLREIERYWEAKKPKVEVAKVKGWEEGSLSEAEVRFEKMCQSHDWYYQYSDSRTVQDNGDASWEKLEAARKELGERGDMIFKFYRP